MFFSFKINKDYLETWRRTWLSLSFQQASPVHWITGPTRKVGWDSLQSWGRQFARAGCWGGWGHVGTCPMDLSLGTVNYVWYAMGWGSGILISTGPATDRNRTWIWVRSKSIGSTGQLITQPVRHMEFKLLLCTTKSLLDSGNSFWRWSYFWMSSGFRTHFDTVKSENLTGWKRRLRSLNPTMTQIYLSFWNYDFGNFSAKFALGKGWSPVQRRESE